MSVCGGDGGFVCVRGFCCDCESDCNHDYFKKKKALISARTLTWWHFIFSCCRLLAAPLFHVFRAIWQRLQALHSEMSLALKVQV